MTRTGFGFTDPPVRNERERLQQQAKAHAIGLRRAFHISVSRRHDTQTWTLLEDATATLLERNRQAPWQQAPQPGWFVVADEKLKTSATALLGLGAPNSSRASHYRRAAEQVYDSAEAWGRTLDGATVAYWRHAALVWMTLWHIADVPDLTAREAEACLNVAFTQAGNVQSVPELSPKKAVRSRLSEAARVLAGAFRKGA